MDADDLGQRILEAKSRLEEISNASHQNIDDAFKRYEYALSGGGLVNEALQGLTPSVDFDNWYADACKTQGGMVGSARLNWPLEPSERVALQYELVKRIAKGEINLTDFTFTFTYQANNFDENNYAFYERVLVPFHNDLIRVLTPLLEDDDEEEDKGSQFATDQGRGFVDPVRIAELKSVTSDEFDTTRIVQYCVELDSAFRNGSFLAVAALTRALIDHVPPVFSCASFTEVANNYSGSKSFKDSMKHLNSSARSIGDAHLHTHIRRSEILPTATQVNFANDLDVLLSEIVRTLK